MGGRFHLPYMQGERYSRVSPLPRAEFADRCWRDDRTRECGAHRGCWEYSGNANSRGHGGGGVAAWGSAGGACDASRQRVARAPKAVSWARRTDASGCASESPAPVSSSVHGERRPSRRPSRSRVARTTSRSAERAAPGPRGSSHGEPEEAARGARDDESSNSSTRERQAARRLRRSRWWALLRNFCDDMGIEHSVVLQEAAASQPGGQALRLRPLLRLICGKLAVPSLKPLLRAVCDALSADRAALLEVADGLVAGAEGACTPRKRRHREDAVDMARSLASALAAQHVKRRRESRQGVPGPQQRFRSSALSLRRGRRAP